MKQTRQPVCTIKQSIYLDVYGFMLGQKFLNITVVPVSTEFYASEA